MMRTSKIANVAITVTLPLLCLFCLNGILPGMANARPHQIAADGTEVTDQGSGLIWRRCIEGMSWDGVTCTGTPEGYTHSQAPKQAAAQAAATGKGWRLPNHRELSSISDSLKQPPAVDPATFPAAPTGWFWSVSPNVGYKNYAWYLDFVKEYANLGYDWYVHNLNDSVYGYNRDLTKYIRLVRDGQ